MDLTLARVKDNLIQIDLDVKGILQFIHVVIDTQRATIQSQQAQIVALQAQIVGKEMDAEELAAFSADVRLRADEALADINPPVEGS